MTSTCKSCDNFQKIRIPLAKELVMPGGVLIEYDMRDGVTVEHF